VPPRGTEPSVLIEGAVTALQQAKDSGRNRAVVIDTLIGELGAA